ncbi:unnamed protein product [Echinostoma caproni]|uniref:Reverse transcriptase domain-containing protein n=1 Tax=Echinostoma caproni TaxID=27848 RepID=A0A183AKV9_9TREM|nr:unnamed protein product [Echinostoma caproni]
MKVDKDSREMLTTNIHRSLFQYQRLPFSVKTAPAILRQVMDTMRTGIDGAAAYLDDIIVTGKTSNELSQQLHSVLTRIPYLS